MSPNGDTMKIKDKMFCEKSDKLLRELLALPSGAFTPKNFGKKISDILFPRIVEIKTYEDDELVNNE